jgi:L-amino acid N-acyltransferase YncA
MVIREASPGDWPSIWRFMHTIVAGGETFSWHREISEKTARDRWMGDLPRRTYVAVEGDGIVLGSAVMGPNHEGPAAHVATASFMVDPGHSGRGAGRRLGEHVLQQARADGYRAMVFNAVVESNVRAVALWRSLGFVVLTTIPEGFCHPSKGYVGLHIMYQRL